ncbi:hypothetical protein N9N68_02955 [Gammaproteobacteria bacterium]|nr:hypothetical protein [Gammaproteobacteria bacterium]
MQISTLKKILVLGAVLIISSCGTTPMRTAADGTYTISAQYGSLNGSWERASSSVNEQALNFCNESGKKVVVIEEIQDGVWGVSPQRSTLRFYCTK